jgi:hypothetical protein
MFKTSRFLGCLPVQVVEIVTSWVLPSVRIVGMFFLRKLHFLKRQMGSLGSAPVRIEVSTRKALDSVSFVETLSW